MNKMKSPYRLVGGRLCLNFVNTADWNSDGEVVDEKFINVDRVKLWCTVNGLTESVCISEQGVQPLREFRLAIRRLLLPIVTGGRPDTALIERLSQTVSSLPASTLVCTDRLQINYHPAISVEQMVAVSTVAVLTSNDETERIKLCPGADCGWFFLDETRNGRRRWCAMATCGNREKSRRHYLRQ